MQFRLPVAIFIFLGSYLPLSLILLAQDYDYAFIGKPICWEWFAAEARCTMPFRNPWYSIGIFLICLGCFGATLAVLRISKTKRNIKINEARYVASDLMNYTLPYVVSFMSIEYHDTGKFVGLVIFLAWMFWITHRSGQIILNPLLIAFGWRLYDISYEYAGSSTLHTGLALADDAIRTDQTYAHTIIQDVVIIKANVEGGE